MSSQRDSSPSKQEVDRFDVFSEGMRKGYGEHWVQATDYDAALAEIERLTAENEMLRKTQAPLKGGIPLAQFVVEQERDRLRAALERMVDDFALLGDTDADEARRLLGGRHLKDLSVPGAEPSMVAKAPPDTSGESHGS